MNPLKKHADPHFIQKENILRSLVSRGASVTAFPYDYPIHQVAHHFDGVFISNGPGGMVPQSFWICSLDIVRG